MEPKYHVGDMVKVKSCYGITEGEIVCISKSRDTIIYGVYNEQLCGSGHNCSNFNLIAGKRPTGHNTLWFRDAELSLFIEQKIIIKQKGVTVIATKYVNGKKVAEGVAKCDTRFDKFDFDFGAGLAFRRLEKIVNSGGLFNGKALSTCNKCGLKANKIYTFVDGFPINENGKKIKEFGSPITLDGIKNCCDYNSWLFWIDE